MTEVTAAVIWQGGQVPDLPATIREMLWASLGFSCGKIKPGETAEECIVCERREYLGVTLKVNGEFYDNIQEHPDRVAHMHISTQRSPLVSGFR